MNHKNHITPVRFISNALKVFLFKLTQPADYYNTKYDYKTKRRQRHNNEQW